MLRYQLEPVKRYKITRSASGSPCEILRTQQSLGFTRFRLLSLSFLSRRDGQWLATPRVVLARGLSFRRLSDVWSWLWKQLRYIHTSTLPQMTARAPVRMPVLSFVLSSQHARQSRQQLLRTCSTFTCTEDEAACVAGVLLF